jgi:putative restriction endonuclease
MRVVRDRGKSRRVKEIYNYVCQICGVRLETPAGAYAEGAQIKPLGRPHDAPDAAANILCLCPNHHVLFDVGAITLSDELNLIGIPDEPKLRVQHEIGLSTFGTIENVFTPL